MKQDWKKSMIILPYRNLFPNSEAQERRKPLSKIIGIAVILLYLILLENLYSQELPSNLKAVFILKIVCYDRLMVEKVKSETFNIGILRKENSDSIAMKKNIDNLFKKGTKILDKNGKSIIIDYKDSKDLETFLKLNNIVVLYISSDLTGNIISEIITVTRKNKVLTFTGSNIKANLKRGISVGLGVEGGKPKIYVNLKASNKEGCEFSSQFLKLSEIVE